MKKLVIFYFFSLGFLQAQNIDSLTIALQNASNNEKAALYFSLAEANKEKDLEKTFTYCKQALQYALKENQHLIQAKSQVMLGTYYLIKSDYIIAEKYFIEAEKGLKTLINAEKDNLNLAELQTLLAKTYANHANIFTEKSKYYQGLIKNQEALKLFKILGKEAVVGQIYNNIGVIYLSVLDYEKALENFKNAAKIQSKLNDATIGYTFTNIARIYVKLNQKQNAKIYFEKAKNIFQKNPDARGEGELYNNLALLELENNNFEAAENYLNQAKKQFESLDYEFGLSDTYLFLGKLFLQKNDFINAKIQTLKAEIIANNLDVTETQANVYSQLSQIAEKTNQPNEALEYLKKHLFYKNQLTDVKIVRENFEQEKQQALENLKIEQEQAEKLNQEKNFTQKLLWIFGLIFLSGIIISYLLIKNQKEAKKKAELQKELADYEQKALHLQMNPHFVFNCLAAISAFIMQNSKEEAVKYLSKFSKLMRLTLDFSKESLITVDKEIESLTNYLELEKLRFQESFEFTIHKSKLIEDDTALPPLLLQPLVENAIIHGLVPHKNVKGKLIVDFNITDKNLIITITDNGIGYEKAQEMKAKSVFDHQSMALEIIKKRLNKLNPNQKEGISIKDLTTANQQGTQVILWLPLQYIEPQNINL